MASHYQTIHPPRWTMVYRGVEITAYEANIGPRCCETEYGMKTDRCLKCNAPLRPTRGTVVKFKIGGKMKSLVIREVVPNDKALVLAKEWVDRMINPADAKHSNGPANIVRRPPPPRSPPPSGPRCGCEKEDAPATLATKIAAAGWPGKAAEIWKAEKKQAQKARTKRPA